MIIITIPNFKSDKETANFWDNHSFEDYFDDVKEAEIEFVPIPKKRLTVRLATDNLGKEYFDEKIY